MHDKPELKGNREFPPKASKTVPFAKRAKGDVTPLFG